MVSPRSNLVAISDREVGKAMDCEDGGFAFPVWLLVDEAVGVRRAIVAGDCRCATMENIDRHDEEVILSVVVVEES